MHFEKASVEPVELDAIAVEVLELELPSLPEDPQAATAHATTTRARVRR
jgi:hypothetical protein